MLAGSADGRRRDEAHARRWKFSGELVVVVVEVAVSVGRNGWAGRHSGALAVFVAYAMHAWCGRDEDMWKSVWVEAVELVYD